MSRIARKVIDKRLLKLIGKYLRAGVMIEGVLHATTEGTPQGGPFAPPTILQTLGGYWIG
jgi:RNA-directed DNA polymerase